MCGCLERLLRVRWLYQPLVEQSVEFGWSVLLDEVAGGVDELESAPGYETVESVRSVDWYPVDRGSPHDQGGNLDVGVEGFDLVGVALVSLGNLPVERRLPGGSEPWRYLALLVKTAIRLNYPGFRGGCDVTSTQTRGGSIESAGHARAQARKVSRSGKGSLCPVRRSC